MLKRLRRSPDDREFPDVFTKCREIARREVEVIVRESTGGKDIPRPRSHARIGEDSGRVLDGVAHECERRGFLQIDVSS